MARLLTPKDAYALVNAVNKQLHGEDALTAIDTSSFVSVGEQIMQAGISNVMNALALLVLERRVASRKYTSAFPSVNRTGTGIFSHRINKISFYSKPAMPDGAFNTDLFTNLADGFDNNANGGASVKSMWEQCPSIPLEVSFGGTSVWDDCLTRYKIQLQQAFRDETSFLKFLQGMAQEKDNDIEQQKESFIRSCIINYMGMLFNAENELHNGMAVNMTKAFNDEFGTSYTTAELQTTHLQEFLEFFTSYLKILKDDFKERDILHHWSVPKVVGEDESAVTYHILRHTPSANFRGMFSSRFFRKAESRVFPTVFNEQYLEDGKGYDLVNFWQARSNPNGIKVEPAMPDLAGTNGGLQTKGAKVELDYVLGFVYDEDALMVDFQLDDVETTVPESRKKYTNTWYTMARNFLTDISEKGCLLYMADPIDDSGSKLSVNLNKKSTK